MQARAGTVAASVPACGRAYGGCRTRVPRPSRNLYGDRHATRAAAAVHSPEAAFGVALPPAEVGAGRIIVLQDKGNELNLNASASGTVVWLPREFCRKLRRAWQAGRARCAANGQQGLCRIFRTIFIS